MMVVTTARLTKWKQVKIPQTVCQAIGAEVGDDLLFFLVDDGQAMVKVLKRVRLGRLDSNQSKGNKAKGPNCGGSGAEGAAYCQRCPTGPAQGQAKQARSERFRPIQGGGHGLPTVALAAFRHLAESYRFWLRRQLLGRGRCPPAQPPQAPLQFPRPIHSDHPPDSSRI